MLRPPLQSPGARFRELIKQDTLVMPGVFNAISAVSAHKAGAAALYLSGAGMTNGTLGVPDVAMASLTEFAQIASYVCGVAPVPVISDADTGFGEGLNTMRTVIEMERAGLAGIHLEDQVSPKRCGHLDGKSVISADNMEQKIRAAADSRRDPSFVIIARTDARGVEGLESAVDRANKYVVAGADAIFPEGLQSEEEFAAFRNGVKAPLMANMTEFGKTPIISAARFKELGYEMVIYPMTAFRVMLKALDDCYAELLQKGTQGDMLDRMRTRAELYERIEYSAYETKDKGWSGEGWSVKR
jgi:methylisocitrate lyase